MMNRLKKRWFAVGILWGAVLAITVWNMVRISVVQQRHQDLETLKMDKRYLNANIEEIETVQKHQAGLVHRVQSQGMGFVIVESDLKRISRETGLTQIRIEAKNNSQMGQAIPIQVSTTGPVAAIVKWLTTVEKVHPYLFIGRIDVIYDEHHRTGQMRGSFDYRYSLASQEGPS